ncbi:hypothetical protein [Calothrix sp. CCY 0018]|uniref:hypothetical protein n=1 Tax=Calothrix sp. CCY 0018 TaxID=3103864 RepID=UPI0039C60980
MRMRSAACSSASLSLLGFVYRHPLKNYPLDGNYAMRVAKYGMVASSNGQVRLPSAGCYEAFEASLLNQILYWWGI